MKNAGLFIIAASLLLSTSKLSAQTYTTGHEDKKAEVNLAELTQYFNEHPTPLVRKPMFDEDDEDEERPNAPEPPASLVHMYHRPAARQIINPSGVGATISNSPADTFLAVTSDGTAIPPDTHGGVDSNYVMTAINTVVHIQKRSNHLTAFDQPLGNFWTKVLPNGTGAFDPRIHFDPYNHRWIFITDAVNNTGMTTSTILIAVSKTSDPTGSWYEYAVTIDATNAAWLDYPCVGFNNKWVTVTGNFFANSTGGQTGAAVYVFDYAKLMAGTSASYTKISQSAAFTICPALTYDPNEATQFLVDDYKGSSGKTRIWKITGPVNAPVMTQIGFPTITTKWSTSFSADAGPQSGIANKMDCGDNRTNNLTYRNGYLWYVHNAFLPSGGATRCSAMWWQVDTAANVVQNGLIDDPTAANFYVYPSIAVNQQNDAIIGFSNLSKLSHPNAGYVLRQHLDPVNILRTPFLYRHGLNTYYQTFGGAKNRWGDYSCSSIDPINMNDFWTIQQSVPSTPNLWDTWWAHVLVCPADAGFVAGNHNSNLNLTDTFTFNGSAPTGTTYSWDFGSGATPATSTAPGPIPVKWSTAGTKTVTVTVTVGDCSTTYTDTIHVQNYGGISEVNAAAMEIV